jgi:hypothetical protein
MTLISTLLLGFVFTRFCDALVRQPGSVRLEGQSFCDASEPFIDSFQQQYQREPKVALVVAEELRFPARSNERLKLWAHAVNGADLFVATDPDSEEKIQFLPKPTRVGIFNHTFDKSIYSSIPDFEKLAFQQLLRTGDALKLVVEAENKQGWKYDVVARMRTEIVQEDACVKGPEQGCYSSAGMLQKAIAAKSLGVEGRGVIYVQHDRAYWGRRDDMLQLFEHIEAHLADVMEITFTRRELPQPGKYQSYDLHASQHPNVHISPDDIPNENTLHAIANQLGFHQVDVAGMEIRRFGCDYSLSEGVADRPDYHPKEYAIGCLHYPRLKDATEHKCP